MDTGLVGEISEAMFVATCLRRGYVVLRPVGQSHRYDFVIDRGQGFERVQCKTGRLKNGTVVFKTSSVGGRRSAQQKAVSYKGQIDLFGVYCPETDECFLVSIFDTKAERLCSLRIDPAKNNQETGILWAKNFRM